MTDYGCVDCQGGPFDGRTINVPTSHLTQGQIFQLLDESVRQQMIRGEGNLGGTYALPVHTYRLHASRTVSDGVSWVGHWVDP